MAKGAVGRRLGIAAVLLILGFAGGLAAGLNWSDVTQRAHRYAGWAFALIRHPNPPASPDAVTITDKQEGGIDHFLGPSGAIRTVAHDRVDESAVTLAVVIDPAGNVVSAIPTDGPRRFFDQARTVAAAWKFIPYQRKGKPVFARLEDMSVPILPPEKRPQYRVPFPAVKDWNSVVVSLARSACFGECMSYSVSVRGDGTVEYDGRSFVALVGKHKAKVPRDVVRRLVQSFREADFFWLDDEYNYPVTDVPSYLIAIRFDGHSRTVMDRFGPDAGMPSVVTDLEHEIDRALDTARWLFGNGETAPSLVAENWDFKAKSCAAQSVLAGVAHYGTRGAVRNLIVAGAPVTAYCKDETGFGIARGPAVVHAATRGDYDITLDLVQAGANADNDAMKSALVSGAAAGNERIVADVSFFMKEKADKATLHSALVAAAGACSPATVQQVMELGAPVSHDKESVLAALGGSGITRGPECAQTITLLAKAGASVDGRDLFGDTALIKNCCSVEIAKALIAAGADVSAANQIGTTALMSAWHADVALALLQAGADPYAKNREGQTAVEILTQGNYGKGEPARIIRDWMTKHPNRNKAVH